jgi:hypothetical protein
MCLSQPMNCSKAGDPWWGACWDESGRNQKPLRRTLAGLVLVLGTTTITIFTIITKYYIIRNENRKVKMFIFYFSKLGRLKPTKGWSRTKESNKREKYNINYVWGLNQKPGRGKTYINSLCDTTNQS